MCHGCQRQRQNTTATLLGQHCKHYHGPWNGVGLEHPETAQLQTQLCLKSTRVARAKAYPSFHSNITTSAHEEHLAPLGVEPLVFKGSRNCAAVLIATRTIAVVPGPLATLPGQGGLPVIGY